jgi:signal peptidase I
MDRHDRDDEHTTDETPETYETYETHETHVKGPNEAWEWTKALGIAILIAVSIRVLLFAPIVVDGVSMMPTLQDGEKLIVNKAIFFISEPKRGDIIVFHATEDKDWIKRVIGEPGDTVEVKDDALYINDEIVDEPYLDISKSMASGILTNGFRSEVPVDHIFVMGDNRQNSRDSRMIGAIPIDSVFGRAEAVFWPITGLRWVK